jgi:YD repeat-containing protein
VYVSAQPPEGAQCGSRCNGVGHPIDPIDGAVYDTVEDLPSTSTYALEFKRHYDSSDRSASKLNQGWRHSFSRSIRPTYSESTYRPYAAGPGNSPLYTDEATACVSGFAQIKSQVTTWANATASYSSGACTLRVGTTVIGRLPILYNAPPTPAPGVPVLIGFDAIRDDGQVIGFMLDGSSISSPPGINLNLQQTSTGYVLINATDAVEAYDSSGKLMSVTSRSGIAQIINYDLSGRLSTVTNGFGGGLTLTYDSEGRLSTVTRQ